MTDIFAKLAEFNRAGISATLCIVVDTIGSTPRKAGSKMIVTGSGESYGTIGGGTLEYQVTEEAKKISKGSKPQKMTFNLEDDLSMHCGGKVEVYMEPYRPRFPLVIFGAGHVGSALAALASKFGFGISIIDHRPEVIEKIQGQDYELIMMDFIKAAETFPFTENSFIVVTTPKHEFDEHVTAICATKPHLYLGMIGSKAKVSVARENFLKSGLDKSVVDKIDMPIGIPFNAQTPEEIAVSILARLIDVKNCL